MIKRDQNIRNRVWHVGYEASVMLRDEMEVYGDHFTRAERTKARQCIRALAGFIDALTADDKATKDKEDDNG